MKIPIHYIIAFFSIALTLSGIGNNLYAQGKKQVIQFSGVVVGEDSTSGVPGVHIYVPKAGRGTTSNGYGYFSMPVLPNDSVVISAVGYQKQFFIIPETDRQSITVAIELLSDTTFLPTVEIFPYPTEEHFKEAVLAMQLPDEDNYNRLRNNMNEEVLARMFKDLPMDGSGNFKHTMNQQFFDTHRRSGVVMNPLLDPFAWANFIRSIKRGDFKKN
ncbi:MAG: carboxypeptidase-like regulatory domain-containing protein [Bacteroidota bacterium]|nr:carboxypeptidase-like regulatory domain-containing protein [Bacteroidota bacterium]